MTAPAPGALPPQCLLYVDGVRYNDGDAGGLDGDPVALDGLVVTWGRSNSLDQPSPASATFEILDVGGGGSFRPALYVGARIDILASTLIHGDPTLSTFADPGFESGTFGGRVAAGTARVVTTPPAPHAGARCLRVEPAIGARSVTVTIPPRPFSSNPVAWDAVPRAQAGQKWQAQAWLMLAKYYLAPGQASAYVQAVAFTHPDGRTPAIAGPRVPVSGGVGVWQQVTIPDVLAPVDCWIGVQVTIATGPAWNDVNTPPLAWDDLPATLAWDDVGAAWLDDVDVLAPPAGALRQGAVFSGRITDLDASYDSALGGTLVRVIGQDDLAELANRYVGSAPWPAQTVAARVAAIVAAAAQPRLTASVDVGVRTRALSYLDVDAQPAAGLLATVAQSVGGALWVTTSVAAQSTLRIEDIDARPAMLWLVASDVAVNLFTRPSFEDNITTSFTPTGCTLSTPTTSFPPLPNSGTKLLRCTATVAGATDVAMANAIKVPVIAGRLYRVAVYVRSGAAAPTATVRLDAEYRDAGNVLVPGTAVQSAPRVLSSTTWFRLEVTTAAAPAGAVTLTFNLRGISGVAVGNLIDWDAILVHEVTTAADPTLDYFDGDTPAAAGHYYGWTGAQWASTSTRSGPVVISVATAAAAGITLDACDVLLDPVRWVQDSTDTATQVAVGWRQQTAAGPPPTITEVTETRTDDTLTASRGRFRVGISTELSTLADAGVLADTMLARLSVGGWRVSGLAWQLDQTELLDGPALTRVMQVLDGTTRVGLPVLLTGLPDWSPIAPGTDVPLYLEGGRFSNTEGVWRLELETTSAISQGKAAVAWDQLPAAWSWDQFDPAISWNDLAGVGLAP